MKAQSTRTPLTSPYAFAVGVFLGAALAAILFGLVTTGHVGIPETGDRTAADSMPVAYPAVLQGEGAVDPSNGVNVQRILAVVRYESPTAGEGLVDTRHLDATMPLPQGARGHPYQGWELQ